MATRNVQERLDRLYGELADLKREIILTGTTAVADSQSSDERVWSNLLEVAEEVSKQWTGASAMEEIRAQRAM